MAKLIKERFPTKLGQAQFIHEGHDRNKLLCVVFDSSNGCDRFYLHQDCISCHVGYRALKRFKFNIANPEFNPEMIIEWIKNPTEVE